MTPAGLHGGHSRISAEEHTHMKSAVVDRFVNLALAACLGVMTCIVLANIICRSILNISLDWSGEMASFLFAWLTFVGVYQGFRNRSYIAIDTLVVLLPQRTRRALAQVVDLGCLGLLLIIIWQGVNLALMTWGLEYPAMQISRGYLYASLPVGGALMALAIIIARWSGPESPPARSGESS
jgi:C4-dicarboxylate transporter DctQ subunit